MKRQKWLQNRTKLQVKSAGQIGGQIGKDGRFGRDKKQKVTEQV